jgi:micrococcal nuclease
MKKASRALFLVAAALCAVVLGRMATKGLRSGLPEAHAVESRAPIGSSAGEVSGVVTRVSDGDTIWVQDAKGLRHKIRMLDIDAPESTQAFGGESTARLKSLIGGKQVKVTYSETDKYGRLLGTVWLGGEDVNLKMVAEGMAWCYHYSKNERYAAAQTAACTRRAGLWANPNAQDPWAYRKGIKPQGGSGGVSVERVAQTQPASTQVLGGYFSSNRIEYRAGNGPVASRTPAPVCDKWPDTGWWLSTNSMKRHNRGCENYRKTRGYPCRKDEGSPCGKCGG